MAGLAMGGKPDSHRNRPYAMIRIAHLVNPFVAPESSDLHTAQPITWETIRRAQAAARELADVELWAALYPKDAPALPGGFSRTQDLDRSVLECGQFEQPRPYPLIADLLERLYAATDAEYLVYTNVDIALQPQFYQQCVAFIQKGNDAFIINRRRIAGHYTRIEEIEAMQAEKGLPHPGFDCFVFHRDLFPRMQLHRICIGVPYIGITLAQNLFALAKNPKVFDQEYLTWHIGLEIFKKRAPREYFYHNQREFHKLVEALWPEMDIRKFPWYEKWLPVRVIKWGLNPSIPIRLALRLQWRGWFGS